MYKYSNVSKQRLASCHPDLQLVFNEVIRHRDCSILCGHRGEHEQNAAFAGGFSGLRYPQSKHNKLPSLAVDVMPYFQVRPHIRWDDNIATTHFAGFVLGVASQMGISLEWGGNWKGGWDKPHYQLSVK